MSNNVRVLVANPDPGIRRLLRRHFDAISCATTVIGTAHEAISSIKRSPPDLMVASAAMTDSDGLMMLLPKGNGLTATQLLDCGADECIEETFDSTFKQYISIYYGNMDPCSIRRQVIGRSKRYPIVKVRCFPRRQARSVPPRELYVAYIEE